MSAIILQPFASYDEGLKPPEFEYNTEDGHIEPDKEQVISMLDGIVLLRYDDDVWDLSPYSADNWASLNFTSIVSDSLKNEAKRLVYLIMTHSIGRMRNMPSGGTILTKLNDFIKPFAVHIQHLPISEEEKSFNYMFAHIKRFRSFIILQARSKPYTAESILSTLKLLKENSKERTGFEYVPSKRTEKALGAIKKRYKDGKKQTLLIPVSIYVEVAKMRWEHINNIEPYANNLAGFIHDYTTYEGFGSQNSSKLNAEKKVHFVSWKQAVKKHKLGPLFKKYQVTKIQDLFDFIYKLQGTSRHLIHQYTGMRDNECRSLSRDCWRDKNKTMPSRIHGIEQKIHGVPTPQVWITHDAIKRVIDILKTIGEPMAKHANPELKNPPLMIKISKLRNKNTGDKHYKAIYPIKGIRELLLNNLEDITLTQEHIHEMSLVSDYDVEEHERIKAGTVWQFKTHQYRRALAVYALGSELLSIHAIKEQFGHLLTTMAAYYGKGHKSARKLDGSIDEQDHISNYISKIKKDMMFYSYRKNVLLSNMPLYGAYGIFLEKHIVAKTPEEREVVMRNSVKLKNDFKKNGMYYEETAIGGCTNFDCEKRLLPDFFLSFSCISCDHSIHRLYKVERLTEKIRLASMKYAEIQPNGINHRTMIKMYDEINHFTDILRRKEQKKEDE